MGKGAGSERGAIVGETAYRYHYTAVRFLTRIVRTCHIRMSNGVFGRGVYLTDLRPSPDRAGISQALWHTWAPESLEAYVAVPFDPEEAEATVDPHVWVVRANLWIAGLDLFTGVWSGSEPWELTDTGDWSHEPFTACNPPPAELWTTT